MTWISWPPMPQLATPACGPFCSSRSVRPRRSRGARSSPWVRAAASRCGTARSTRTAPTSERLPRCWTSCRPGCERAATPRLDRLLQLRVRRSPGFADQAGRARSARGLLLSLRRRLAVAGRSPGLPAGARDAGQRRRRRGAAGASPDRQPQRLPVRRFRRRRRRGAGAHPRRLGLPGQPLASLPLRRSRRSTRWPATSACARPTRAPSWGSSKATIGRSSRAAPSACSTARRDAVRRAPIAARGRAARATPKTRASRPSCAPASKSRPSTSCSSTCCATTFRASAKPGTVEVSEPSLSSDTAT